MLLPRVLTALVILPLFLAALFGLPQLWWGGVVLVVALLGCLEWGRLIALSRAECAILCLMVLAACVYVGFQNTIVGGGPILLGVAIAIWIFAVPLWLRGAITPSKPMLAAAGTIVLSSSWYALFDLQQSASRLLVLMSVVWIADTAAYFAGRGFGKRKLAPRISPGKTWEGVAGAMVAVAVYYALLWWVWAPTFLLGSRWLDLLIVVGMIFLSIEGDLFESWLKRRAGVKDSGTLLPGHGGILDRIDGVVAALPFAALLTHVVRG